MSAAAGRTGGRRAAGRRRTEPPPVGPGTAAGHEDGRPTIRTCSLLILSETDEGDEERDKVLPEAPIVLRVLGADQRCCSRFVERGEHDHLWCGDVALVMLLRPV